MTTLTYVNLPGVNGTGNLNVGGNGNIYLSANLGNSGSFTSFQSTSTITFGPNISANSTGNFTVYGGLVSADLGTTIASTGNINLLGGQLQFGAAPGTIVTHFAGSAVLNLGGGALYLPNATNAGNFYNKFSALSLQAGSSYINAVGGAGSGGGGQYVTFPNPATRAIGSILMVRSGGTTAGANNLNVQFGSAPTLTGNLLGGWALAASGATVSNFASTQLLNGNYVMVPAPFESSDLNGATTLQNVSQSLAVAGNVYTLGGSKTVNSLAITGNTTANALDLNGNTLTLTTGGLMLIGTGNDRDIIKNGTLTAGASGVGGELFVVTQGVATPELDLAATIADNSGGKVNLTYGGSFANYLYLSGSNSYSGKTALTHGNGTSGLVYILTKRQLGASPASASTDKLILNNANLNFVNYMPVTLATNRGITLGGGRGKITGSATGAVQWNLAAPIAGVGPLTISTTVEGILSGASTFDGALTNANTSPVDFTSIGNVGGGASALGAPSTVANGTILTTNSGGWRYVGAGPAASNRDFQATVTVAPVLRASGANPLTLNGNIYLSTSPNLLLILAGTGPGFVNGNILQTGSGNSTLTSGGDSAGNDWQLAGENNYAGVTTVSAGVLEFTTVGNVGAGPSSLGAPTTAANGTLTFTGGTLRFVGSTNQSTDRAVSLTNAGTLEASGTGNITYLGGVSVSNQALTLGGTGYGFISGNAGITGTGTVTKNGFNTWTISPVTANTYTGATTVNAGNLVVTTNSSGGSTGMATVNGGILRVVSTGFINASSIKVNSLGTFDYQNHSVSPAIDNGSFSNHGTVLVGNNATVTVQNGTTYAGYSSPYPSGDIPNTIPLTGNFNNTLALLDGATPTGNYTLNPVWRDRTSNEKYPTGTHPPLPLPTFNLLSDVVQLNFTAAQNDVYVLQMSYNPDLIAWSGNETTLVADKLLYLAYRDPSGINPDTYTNAGNPAYDPQSSYDHSYLGTVGTWGVDTTNHVAWAVVGAGGAFNPNGMEFAVVPEPGSLALLAFGSWAVLHLRRRRK